MAPRTSSWPVFNGIKSTDYEIKSADDWIEARRKEEGADELWRIHDGLYDVEKWIHKHPGGTQWLEITKVSIHFFYTLFHSIKCVFFFKYEETCTHTIKHTRDFLEKRFLIFLHVIFITV